jgi:predicted metal-dependent hydrolase
MSHKSGEIAERIRHLEGRGHDPHYLGFFECFNNQQFYEAHDVLEELWLVCRGTEKNEFYKALIQLAGAFVHLQKERISAAGKLLRLSRSYFVRYPETFESISVKEIISLIDEWHGILQTSDFESNPLKPELVPILRPPAE